MNLQVLKLASDLALVVRRTAEARLALYGNIEWPGSDDDRSLIILNLTTALDNAQVAVARLNRVALEAK